MGHSASGYHVKFPGLSLELDIQPTAFQLFGVTVYWYGVIICLGFILAFYYAIRNSNRFNLNPDDLSDAIIAGLFTAIVGARLYYVAFFPGDTYIKDPFKVLFINEGGIAIYGGIIGGLLGGALVARIRHLKLLPAFDISAIGLLLGQGIGRWGNFFNQEAFGSETDNLFRMSSQATGGITVHPCFLYESLWCLLGFLLLHLFSRQFRRYDGQVFLLYIVWYGAERFIVEGLRTDSLYIPFVNVKASQLLALVSMTVGSILLVFKARHTAKLH